MKGKMFFKVAALLIIAVLVFAACTGGAGQETTTTTAPPVATTAPGATTVPQTTLPGDLPEPQAAAPEFPDLGGRVVRISTINAGINGFLGPLTPDAEFVAPNPEDAHYHRVGLQYNNRLRVEEAFNIVIEPILMSGGSSHERVSLAVLAGEIFADIVEDTPPQNFRNMINGYIYSINDLAELLPGVDLDILTTQHTSWPHLEIWGHIWAMGRPLPVMNNSGVLVNLDIIEAFGAPNPVELYERGEWTWDAMRQIMEMTTADTTGDGNIDTWGVSGNLNDAIRHLMAANDAWMVDPDTLTLGHPTPAGMQALDFVYEIMMNWWMPGDFGDASPARGSTPNNFAFAQGRTALAIATTSATLNNMITRDGLEGNVTWVAHPKGPNNTSGHTSCNAPRHGSTVHIGTEDPHYLLWILDQLWAWPGDEWYELEFQADLEWARRFMPDEAGVQRIFREGIYGVRVDLGQLAGLMGGFHNNMVESWWNGSMTVAQSVEYWRQDRQEAINVAFGR